MMDLKYVVTGTGRCGTVYMARLLTSSGIPCGHESVFDWRGYDCAVQKLEGKMLPQCSVPSTMAFREGHWVELEQWVDTSEIIADSSYMAAPFLDEFDVVVLHVVRNPVKVINSFCNYLDYFQNKFPINAYESFIYQHVPVLRQEMPPYDRAAKFYLLWNRMIEQSCPAHWLRIEDAPDSVVDALKLKKGGFDQRDVNTYERPGRRFCLADLESKFIRDELIEMGSRYGYNMDSLII